MRSYHLDILKEIASSIDLDDQNPFRPSIPVANSNDKLVWPNETVRFFEITPPIDAYEEKIPFCVVIQKPTRNQLDARLSHRISPVYLSDGGKINRFLKRHFKQEFRYHLNFWIEKPDSELLSNVTDRGIIDQCLIYISNNSRTVNPQGAYMGLDVGPSGIVTDPAKKSSVYKVFVEIIIRDGLYSIEKQETLAAGTLEIVEPVNVEEI